MGVSKNSFFGDCQQLEEAISLDKETTAALLEEVHGVQT